MILFGTQDQLYPLLLEDDLGDVREFVRRYLPLALQNLFTVPPAAASFSISGPAGTQINAPYPNWPDPPPIRCNALYWPSGATRWAHFCGLATTATKDAILTALQTPTGHNPGQLFMAPEGYTGRPGFGFESDANSARAIGASMYLLPPRPIPLPELEGDAGGLWIMPLVDARYYWQYAQVPTTYFADTWAEAFTEILDHLGVAYDALDTFDPDFGEPDLGEFRFHLQKRVNAAVLLDWLAYSLGRRVIMDLSGTVAIQTGSAAASRASANPQSSWVLKIAGGNADHERSTVPESLRVIFDDTDETETRDATNYGQTAFTEAAIHAIRFPAVSGDHSDFADALAAEFFMTAGIHYDRSYVGLAHWTPGGCDDAVIWRFGSRDESGCLEAHTQVKSLPYNWGMVNGFGYGANAFYFEIKQDLAECGEVVQAWRVIPGAGDHWRRSPGYKNPETGQIYEPEFTIHPGPLWHGVAWGAGDDGNPPPPLPGDPPVQLTDPELCNRGEIVQAVKVDDRWFAIGSGHRTVWGFVGEDIARDDTGPVNLAGAHPADCENDKWFAIHNGVAEPFEGCEGEFSPAITAKAIEEDLDAGTKVLCLWSNQEWAAFRLGSRDVACGLKLEEEDGPDKGKIRLDPEIAGCGLDISEECVLSVNATEVAGTGLEAEGECSVGLSPDTQATLAQVPVLTGLVAALDAALAALTDIVEELVECCEDSRECCEASMKCCYETTEAIDYIAEFCCEGLENVPGVGDCSGKCVWRSTGAGWEQLVPCAGPDDCECPTPEYNGEPAGDLEFTSCTGDPGCGGVCTWTWDGSWVPSSDTCAVGDCGEISCGCDVADTPTEPGEFMGQQVTTPCRCVEA